MRDLNNDWLSRTEDVEMDPYLLSLKYRGTAINSDSSRSLSQKSLDEDIEDFDDAFFS